MNSLTLAAIDRQTSFDDPNIRREYSSSGTPVILSEQAERWPALTRWTPSFFKEEHGALTVQTYDASFQNPGAHYLRPFGEMTFSNYIDLIESGPTPVRLFLFRLLDKVPKLKSDILLPEWLDRFSHRFLFTFFGGEGGVTTFHYDVDLPHVFHTVLYGTKEFYLFSPKETPRLYRHPFTVRSYIDVGNPDYKTYPLLRDAQGIHCTVHPGETLFIPSGWWHQVVYTGPSYGVVFRQFLPRKIPQAFYNLLIAEPIDRLFTALAPEGWFRWKDTASGRAP